MSKLQTSVSFKNKNKSFKYLLKGIDHITDPCPTPHNNSLHKLNVSLILLFNYLKINLGVSLLNPSALRFTTESL